MSTNEPDQAKRLAALEYIRTEFDESGRSELREIVRQFGGGVVRTPNGGELVIARVGKEAGHDERK